MAARRRALASLDFELTRLPCHELQESQYHCAQPHKDRDSGCNDDNSKAVDEFDNAIKPLHRYSNICDVLLQTSSDALDVLMQTRLHARNGITDGVGSGTPEWTSQRSTKFWLCGHRASSTGELHDRHHESTQANEERDAQGSTREHDGRAEIAERSDFPSKLHDLSLQPIDTCFECINSRIQSLSECINFGVQAALSGIEIGAAHQIAPPTGREKLHEVIRHGGPNRFLQRVMQPETPGVGRWSLIVTPGVGRSDMLLRFRNTHAPVCAQNHVTWQKFFASSWRGTIDRRPDLSSTLNQVTFTEVAFGHATVAHVVAARPGRQWTYNFGRP